MPHVIVIAAMESPPKLFVAGSDALSVITPARREPLGDLPHRLSWPRGRG
jgi:hypothetical protein